MNNLFNNRVQPLGLSSIASVCFTDTNTVQLVLDEILASIIRLSKKGASMRLNFKVGYLTIVKNTIHWQHSRELLSKHGVSLNPDEVSI